MYSGGMAEKETGFGDITIGDLTVQCSFLVPAAGKTGPAIKWLMVEDFLAVCKGLSSCRTYLPVFAKG